MGARVKSSYVMFQSSVRQHNNKKTYRVGASVKSSYVKLTLGENAKIIYVLHALHAPTARPLKREVVQFFQILQVPFGGQITWN